MVTEYVFSEVNVALRDLVYKLVIYINIKPKTISAFETLIDSDFSKSYSVLTWLWMFIHVYFALKLV